MMLLTLPAKSRHGDRRRDDDTLTASIKSNYCSARLPAVLFYWILLKQNQGAAPDSNSARWMRRDALLNVHDFIWNVITGKHLKPSWLPVFVFLSALLKDASAECRHESFGCSLALALVIEILIWFSKCHIVLIIEITGWWNITHLNRLRSRAYIPVFWPNSVLRTT